MKPSKILATCFTAMLVSVAPPAFAQHHGGGGGGGGHASGQSSRGGASRGDSGNRGGDRRGGSINRGESINRGSTGRPEARAIAPRYVGGSRVYSNVRGGVYVGHRGVVGPRYSRIAPIRFYRPYYTFRPRLSLGFGLFAGYPFAYSYGYYDPFYYPYGYVSPYSYPPYAYASPAYPPASSYPAPSTYPSTAPPQGQQGSAEVEPSQANTGGLSFDITPNTAQLFIDGALVGTVGQFTPTSQPLGLVAGRHKVEVRAPGYQTMSFDVDIITGQVIPYQGSMER